MMKELTENKNDVSDYCDQIVKDMEKNKSMTQE